jgi:peptide/nickel transport system ATP-binding protein
MIERGSVEDVFSDPQEEYTRRLLDAVPRIDDAIGELRTTDIAIVAEHEIEHEIEEETA